MLPRNLRTVSSDLPGVKSCNVPLIGYRPLSSNGDPPCVVPDPGPPQSTVVEEEDDGIIYTVVLRQQHTAPNSPRMTVSRSQCVKAGREEKLVLHLFHSFSLGDSSFITVFLATYRSFTSTERVLDILTDRLENPPADSNSSQLRWSLNKAACTVFSTWLSEYPEDFRSLREPSRLLRLAPLLPEDSSSATDLQARLLRMAEELSEQALLPGHQTGEKNTRLTTQEPSIFYPTSILGFPAVVIAEQLTKIETDLFVRLVPYHCLGSLWSQRDKKGREDVCWSVRATVRQFNTLANAVVASCLWRPDLRNQRRAQLMEQWISVAEECRARKNFSSLYAIVSALQSNPLHRLRKTWEETDRDALRRYEELAEIFSDKDNYSQSRELLKDEGTSKFANLDRLNHQHTSRGSAQGTVPYLGLFLTDLTMLDAAVKDHLDNGYINFDKRRREFEVLAQIRLLQSSCKNSVFYADEAFMQWYHSIPTLSEEDSYRLSNEIEPPGEPCHRSLAPTVVITQCPDVSRSRSSLGDIEGLFDFHSPVNNLLSKLTKHMRSPSVSCLDVDMSPSTTDSTPTTLTPSTPNKSHRRSVSCGNNPQGALQDSRPDMRIIKIRMGLQDGNLYRSILVTSNDKTPAVTSAALEKHNQDPGQTSQYELVQLLPEGKELLIPATGNVFYAMMSSSVDFLLRKKHDDTLLGVQRTSIESSATFPRIKAKGRRLVRTLF